MKTTREPGSRQILQEQAYAFVKMAILEARLRPGQLVSETYLASTLGMSRTPIREALRALELEGLIRTVSTRGTFVTELDVTDILEVYQLREILESAAARTAAGTMDRETTDELWRRLEEAKESAARGDFHPTREVDSQVHALIIGATRNSRLVRFMDQIGEQVRRIRALQEQSQPSGARANGQRPDRLLAELQQLVDALRVGDPDGAEKAMREHLANARRNALRFASPAGMDLA